MYDWHIIVYLYTCFRYTKNPTVLTNYSSAINTFCAFRFTILKTVRPSGTVQMYWIQKLHPIPLYNFSSKWSPLQIILKTLNNATREAREASCQVFVIAADFNPKKFRRVDKFWYETWHYVSYKNVPDAVWSGSVTSQKMIIFWVPCLRISDSNRFSSWPPPSQLFLWTSKLRNTKQNEISHTVTKEFVISRVFHVRGDRMGLEPGLSKAAAQGDASRSSELLPDYTRLLAVVMQIRYIKKQTKVRP